MRRAALFCSYRAPNADATCSAKRLLDAREGATGCLPSDGELKVASRQTGHPTAEIDSGKAVAERRSRDRGPRAGSRRATCSGDFTKCAVPSRQSVLNNISTCPVALICTRSSESAGRQK